MTSEGPARSRSTLAILPAHNEGQNIQRVLADARALDLPLDLLVVDDGSDDDTADQAERAGARVIRLPFNCGIGATVQTGVAYGLRQGYERLCRFDSDGQHDPAELPRLFEELDAGADFVIGSRYAEKQGFQSTFLRRLGARWFSMLLRLFCNLRVTDPTSGFWVANRRAAAIVLEEHSSDYPEVDSLVVLKRNGCVVRECAVTMRERAAGHSSIQGLSTLYYMIKVTIALVVGRVRSRLQS